MGLKMKTAEALYRLDHSEEKICFLMPFMSTFTGSRTLIGEKQKELVNSCSSDQKSRRWSWRSLDALHVVVRSNGL
jgi:hypothetical protein